MAKKATTTETKVTVEEVVAPVKVEGVTTETVEVTEAKAEPIKPLIIIAKTSTPFRKTVSLESKYIVGQMPVGIAYEIVREATSKIYGDFYQLNNGYYITKNGNYTIS
jgi:hypothetical protein